MFKVKRAEWLGGGSNSILKSTFQESQIAILALVLGLTM